MALTVVPAYGRDYTNGKEAVKDWEAGKNFIVSNVFDRYDGKPINKADALRAGIREVMIRYMQDRRTVLVAVKEDL